MARSWLPDIGSKMEKSYIYEIAIIALSIVVLVNNRVSIQAERDVELAKAGLIQCYDAMSNQVLWKKECEK